MGPRKPLTAERDGRKWLQNGNTDYLWVEGWVILFYSFSKCISLIFYNECVRFLELQQNVKKPSVTKP